MRGHDQHHSESGVTLVELMFTITLFTVIGGLVLSAFLGLNRAVSIADNVTFDQGFGRNALTLISKDIRAAAAIQQSDDPAFAIARPRDVAFTALIDTGAARPQLVSVSVDASSQIVVTATPATDDSEAPNLVYESSDQRDRYIASFVVNSGSIFRFFDSTGAELTDFSGPSGNLTTAQREQIATVEITLALNRTPVLTGATEIEMTVRLPNAGAEN